MESLFVIAAVAGVIWGAVVFLRGGLLGGCLAVLLAGTCFSVPFFKIELGPVPLTADRLLLLLLVGQYLLWRRWGLADPKPLGKPEIILIVFTGMMAASTFSHDWAASNYQPVSWLILYYLMPAVVYWIARQANYSERAVLALFGCLAAFGAYLAVTALAEYFKASWLVFPSYITTSAMDAKAEFVGRGRGPLLHPIGNGILLAICLSGTLCWWPRLNRLGQLLLAPLVLLLLAGMYVSLTRSVWMGGLLTLALAVGLALPWNWRVPLLGGGLLAGLLLVAAQWENLVAFKRDEALGAEKTAESVELRPIMAVVTWHMFLNRPLFGCGYSQYKTEHENYVSDRSTGLSLERARGYIPHNVVFSLLSETGLVGLGLFLMMIGFWTRDAWRLWRDATIPLWARQQGLLMLIALGAYFINGMFHDVSAIPMANMTLFFLAGVTAGLRPLAAGNSPVPQKTNVAIAGS
jgi:O-antigen ligase